MRAIDWFDRGVALDPSAPLFLCDETGDRLSYGEAAGLAARLGPMLAGRAPRVATLSPNHIRAFTGALAAWRADGAWVPLNARHAVESNIEVMRDVGVTHLLYHGTCAADVARIRAAVASLEACFCLDDDGHAEALTRLPAIPTPDHDRPEDPDALAVVLSSGGSTGRSKMIALSNLSWETLCATALHIMPFEGRPRHLVAAPMTHAAGILVATFFAQGGVNVVLSRAEPRAIVEAIVRHRITHLFLPPTVLYAILALDDVGSYDVSSLRYLLISAAPVSPAKLREAVRVFGACVCQAYGQAESPFFLTWLSPSDLAAAAGDDRCARLFASAGRTTPMSRVVALDLDTGEPLPAGGVGEIAMKGNLRMIGYLDDPDATAETRTADGWQRTGDVGFFDEDGYLYITDRKRDMIVSGGFNIYSIEIESALNSHPDVEASAVFGIPHPHWGEAVTAAVQLKPGRDLAGQVLVDLCREKLGALKAPKSVVFHDSLPRSAVGKILKRELRAPYWQGEGRQVG